MAMLEKCARLNLTPIVLLTIFPLLTGLYCSFFFEISNYDALVSPDDFGEPKESTTAGWNNYHEKTSIVAPNSSSSVNKNDSDFDEYSSIMIARAGRQHRRKQRQRELKRRREIEDIIDNTPPFTFPTVIERVKYSMGDWFNRSITIDYANTHICPFLPMYERQVDWDFYISRNNMNYFASKTKTSYHVKEFLSEANKVVKGVITPSKAIDFGLVMRIGDNLESYRCNTTDMDYPLIKKGRYVRVAAKNKHTLARAFSAERADTRRGIIWPMEIKRHIVEPLTKYKQCDDIPWHLKEPIAFWRGVCSGFYHGLRWNAVEMFYNKSSHTNISYSDCHLPRRRHQQYVTGNVEMQEQLRYKYLLSIEGNDIASNLKWSLASNSLVFMSRPTVATAAGLEEFLVPFVHYIPVKDDLSDLVDMVLWAKDNDSKCKWISQQATQFINDLWDSENAQEDLRNVRIELGERYYNQFGKALYSCIDDMSSNSTNSLID